MEFCETVGHSFFRSVQIYTTNLSCQGARKNIGYNKKDEEMTRRISQNNNIHPEFVASALNEIPFLKEDVSHINLGISREIKKSPI